MPFLNIYNRVAKIISIKRVRDLGICVYTITFKVGKQKFKAYLGATLDENIIQEAIKRTYEHQTAARNRTEYEKGLPGSIIKFKSTL